MTVKSLEFGRMDASRAIGDWSLRIDDAAHELKRTFAVCAYVK